MTAVRNALERATAGTSVIHRPPNFVWTAAKDAELMGLVAEDHTFTFIARFMGLSPAAVSSRFKRLRDQMGAQAK